MLSRCWTVRGGRATACRTRRRTTLTRWRTTFHGSRCPPRGHPGTWAPVAHAPTTYMCGHRLAGMLYNHQSACACSISPRTAQPTATSTHPCPLFTLVGIRAPQAPRLDCVHGQCGRWRAHGSIDNGRMVWLRASHLALGRPHSLSNRRLVQRGVEPDRRGRRLGASRRSSTTFCAASG